MTPRQPILGVFSYSKVFVKSHTNFGISQFYTYHLWYVPAERGIFIYQKWYLCTKIGILPNIPYTNYGIHIPKPVFRMYHLWYSYTKTGISHIPKLVSIYHKWYFTYTKTGITYVPKMVFIPILVLTLLARYAFCTHKTPSC